MSVMFGTPDQPSKTHAHNSHDYHQQDTIAKTLRKTILDACFHPVDISPRNDDGGRTKRLKRPPPVPGTLASWETSLAHSLVGSPNTSSSVAISFILGSHHRGT